MPAVSLPLSCCSVVRCWLYCDTVVLFRGRLAVRQYNSFFFFIVPSSSLSSLPCVCVCIHVGLRELDLAKCPSVDFVSLGGLSRSCRQLRRLVLNRCAISDGELIAMLPIDARPALTGRVRPVPSCTVGYRVLLRGMKRSPFRRY